MASELPGTLEAPAVLLVCSGLDHARRGYESFARECFECLRSDPGVRVELVKGSGQPDWGELIAPPIRRDAALARMLGRYLRVRPFRIEAFTFGLSLAPLLLRRRPDLVYLSEWDTAHVLAALRRLLRLPFRILFCNGGFASAGFDFADHVQELTPAAREHVLRLGADPRRHSVLPYGFHLLEQPSLLERDARLALRRRLGVPGDRPVLLSVAALNQSHKRLGYVIEELARLEVPRPFLLMAGEVDEETPTVRALARARLGDNGFEMRTVPPGEVWDLYRASDIFVLASIAEMQGRALIEAAAAGVPCLAHDYPVTRYALGPHAWFADLTQPGALAALLRAQLSASNGETSQRIQAAHRHVLDRFSWTHLRPRYVDLLQRVAWAKRTVSSSTGE